MLLVNLLKLRWLDFLLLVLQGYSKQVTINTSIDLDIK